MMEFQSYGSLLDGNNDHHQITRSSDHPTQNPGGGERQGWNFDDHPHYIVVLQPV